MNEDIKKVKDSLIKQVETLEKATLYTDRAENIATAVNATTKALAAILLIEQLEGKDKDE